MNESLHAKRVWDLPTRLFHWALAVCVIGSVVSAKMGGDAMEWHFRLGYTVFTLLAFRLAWGFIGGRWSRFVSFTYTPAALWRYVRGRSRSDEHHEVGHSPLGALAVYAWLGTLALQVATGLVADDEVVNTGPLIAWVSAQTSALATSWHKAWGQWLIVSLIVLHVAAITYYRLARRRHLVGAMILGDKAVRASVPASTDRWSTRIAAAVLLSLCAVGVGWVVSLGG